MKIIYRIFVSIFQWIPWSGGLTVLYYLSGGIVPVVITVVSVNLFDNAATVLAGIDAKEALLFYAVLYLVIYLVNDMLGYIRSIALNGGVYEKGTAYFRIALYEKLAKLPLLSFEDANLLNKKERAESAVNHETLSEIFNHSLRLLRSGIAVIGVSVVLTGYSWLLLPLSILSVLPYIIARIIRGREFYFVKKAQAKKTRLLTYLWTLFTTRQAAKEMRVMGFDRYMTDKWQATRDEVNEELWAVQKKDALSLLWCDGIRIAGYGLSVVVVIILALKGNISLGVFGASITAFLSLQESMKEFLERLGNFPEQLHYAGDYYAFLDMPEESDGKEIFYGLQESISLQNVSFTYPNANCPALRNINMTFQKGEKIAIVGENGSGKTTLSKVLLGLYPVQSGQVTYDGTPVGAFTKKSLYAGISAIAQDFVPYQLTLRENVALSDNSQLHNDEKIYAALHAVGVAIRKDELDHIMGREFGGQELSGGQWQKLAIARGIFKDSEMILLDEPTSALDPIIETEILSQFIQAAQDRTAFIISHRVGLCKLVDKIIVMQNGAIEQMGTHTDLLASGGAYARLYNEQSKWYQ